MLILMGATLMIGFSVGLLSFKVKSRWCPHCGSTTMARVVGSAGDGDRRV